MKKLNAINLTHFKAYVKDFGFVPTLVLSIYKLRPKWFSLLTTRFFRSGTVDTQNISYDILMSDVYRYSSWEEMGGWPTPYPVKDLNEKFKTFIWFVPDWSNVWGGGHYTLFRFANHFAKNGTNNIIYIYNNQRHSDSMQLQNELIWAVPDCKLKVIVDSKKLPICDGAIATTWQSAYSVKAFEHAKNKFYFMQDYESYFYAFGTASMQANATYSFGFKGITGGTWLKRCYESHGGTAVNYRFAADKKIFYPYDSKNLIREKVKKVFFYGRPSTERRCFALGLAALQLISNKYPDVEIVIAGLELDTAPPFPATMLGNLTLAATGDLYRTCDIGIAFSATNLSYLPVELMASGVPVISNNGEHIEWHCKNMENAYLCDPVPEAVLSAFDDLYNNKNLRYKLAKGGIDTMEDLTWDDQMQKIFEFVDTNS